ncbi:hypothetical protein ACH5RR_029866 [Cinchona calisaya]|uniref:Uncharacterized protein n=1 Tax=Cinchona calisaya TaxID=153742 RepID=A0ABD2YWG1_9GENT
MDAFSCLLKGNPLFVLQKGILQHTETLQDGDNSNLTAAEKLRVPVLDCNPNLTSGANYDNVVDSLEAGNLELGVSVMPLTSDV